jgi:hypothetical protein
LQARAHCVFGWCLLEHGCKLLKQALTRVSCKHILKVGILRLTIGDSQHE